MEIISKTLQEETDLLFLLKIETFKVIVHSKMNIIMVLCSFWGLMPSPAILIILHILNSFLFLKKLMQ